tara:strand:+ start:1866 stop:2132 length:267 start_codon:yes stop_codon:yes gene_type:complete
VIDRARIAIAINEKLFFSKFKNNNQHSNIEIAVNNKVFNTLISFPVIIRKLDQKSDILNIATAKKIGIIMRTAEYFLKIEEIRISITG